VMVDGKKELNRIGNGQVMDAREDFLQQIREKVRNFLTFLFNIRFLLLI